MLVVVGVVTAGALAFGPDARTRNAALATALATLLIAPATWSVQTLGHATSGTFPAGGPASAAMGGMGGGGRGGGGRGGFGGGQGGPPAGANGGAPGTAPPPAAPPPAPAPRPAAPRPAPAAPPTAPRRPAPAVASAARAAAACSAATPPRSRTALAYIKANGGGTLAVSSQSTAAAAITDSNADIVGIGGFSGRESEVSVAWLADQVSQGKIRWVLADDSGGGGLGNDGRTGSTTAMAAVAAGRHGGRRRRRDPLRPPGQGRRARAAG